MGRRLLVICCALTALWLAACDWETSLVGKPILRQYRERLLKRRLPDIANNASGVTWDAERGSYFVIENTEAKLHEFGPEFATRVRSFDLRDATGPDTEDVVALGGGQVAVVTEENLLHVIQLPGFGEEGPVTVLETYRPLAPPAVANRGLEGVAYVPPRAGRAGRFFVAEEGGGKDPRARMRVVAFDRRSGGAAAARFSVEDSTLAVREPWDAEQGLAELLTDLSGLGYDARSRTLILAGDEVPRLVQVDPESGRVVDQLDFEKLHNVEGVALGAEQQLVLVAEPNAVEAFAFEPPSPLGGCGVARAPR